MAIFTTLPYDGRYLQLEITDTVDEVNNYSTIYWTFSSIGGNNSSYNIQETTIIINGETVYYKEYTQSSSNVFPAVKGSINGIGSQVAYHGPDGTANIQVEFITNVESAIPEDWGGMMSLTPIDRTPPTITASIENTTYHSVDINVTASSTCDLWEYSFFSDWSGSTSYVSTGINFLISINSLDSDTEYTVYLRSRKQTNHVYSQAISISFSTNIEYSTINTITGPIIADSNTVQIQLDISIHSPTYSHTLLLTDLSGTYTILNFGTVSLIDGSNTITLTSSQRNTLLSYMYNKKSFSSVFELLTYKGSTLVEPTSTYTVIISTTSDNSSPIFNSFTYSDINSNTVSITENNQIMIKEASILEVQITSATARNGASITSYSCSIGSKSKTSSSSTINIGVIDQDGSVPLNVTVVDSRGWTSTLSINITVLYYEPIKITSYSLERRNDPYNECIFDIDGTLSPLIINNINKNQFVSLEYRYYKTNEQAGSYLIQSNVVYTDTTFEYTNTNWLNLDTEYSYYIDIKVSDKITYDSITVTIPQAIALMSFRNKKIGINNRNPQEALDILGNARIDGDLIVTGSINPTNNSNNRLMLSSSSGVTIDDVYPIGSVYISTNTVSPATLFGGTWSRISGKLLVGMTDSETVLSEEQSQNITYSSSGNQNATIPPQVKVMIWYRTA